MKGILFDFCGTLFKYEKIEKSLADWQEVIYDCFKGFGLKMPKEEFLIKCNPDILDGDDPKIDIEGTVLEKKFKVFGLEIGMDLNAAQLNEVAERSVNRWGYCLKLEENTISVLKELKKKYVLGIVSNFDQPSFIRNLLNEHNMTNLFDTIVISGDVNVKKPAKEIFDIALNEIGLKNSDVVYVGDGREDILGGNNAGIKPIFIDRCKKNESLYKDVQVISSIDEILKIR